MTRFEQSPYRFAPSTPPVAPEFAVSPLELPVPVTPPLSKRGEGDKGKPVVALDVDGVLNILCRKSEMTETMRRVDTVIPSWACSQSNWMAWHGKENLPTPLIIDDEHGPWIRSLLDRDIEVVWCTTWETAANVVIAPLLGIPPLPVVQIPRNFVQFDVESSREKRQALQYLFDGRPTAWLDDGGGYGIGPNLYELEYVFEDGGWELIEDWQSVGALAPDIRMGSGLTRTVRDIVDKWLDSGPEAKAKGLSEYWSSEADYAESYAQPPIPDLEAQKERQTRYEASTRELSNFAVREFPSELFVGAWFEDIKLELRAELKQRPPRSYATEDQNKKPIQLTYKVDAFLAKQADTGNTFWEWVEVGIGTTASLVATEHFVQSLKATEIPESIIDPSYVSTRMEQKLNEYLRESNWGRETKYLGTHWSQHCDEN